MSQSAGRTANISVAIVGAGTGGLAAATLLKRQGVHVEIFERFEAAAPVGAGILIQPTGLACLANLGVDQDVMNLGRVLHGIDGITRGGREIFNLDYAALSSRCFGLALHRASLFHVLMAAASAANVPIRTNVHVMSAPERGAQRTLVTAANEEFGPFDLIIDASGSRSNLRRAYADVRLDKPYSYGALWAVVPEPKGWPTPHRLTQRYNHARQMTGLMPLGTPPGFDVPQLAFFWSLPLADVAAWRAAPFEVWRDEVAALWPAAADTIAHFTRHEDLAVASYADMWLVRPDEQGLVFIGDACRSASPQLGQGANMALIDALILSRHLNGASKTDLAARLDEYARARRAHTRFYGLASRALTPFFQSNSHTASFLRDLTFKPMARVPYLRREMVRTLTGMKTGILSNFDPGTLHPSFAMRQTSQERSPN